MNDFCLFEVPCEDVTRYECECEESDGKKLGKGAYSGWSLNPVMVVGIPSIS